MAKKSTKSQLFVDPSNSIISRKGGDKFLIRFFHLPTMTNSQEEIKFKAFLTDFSDNYESTWNEESVYGRMDPIPIFENTKRTATLAFDIPSSSEEEAVQNLDKMDRFIQRLYPSYERVNDMNVLSTAPLWRIKFANLLSNSKTNTGIGSAKENGLVCYIKSFSFTPDNDPGYILSTENLFPKVIKVSLSLTILHDHTPGFIQGTFGGPGMNHHFPYGIRDEARDEAAYTGLGDAMAAALASAIANNPMSKAKKAQAETLLESLVDGTHGAIKKIKKFLANLNTAGTKAVTTPAGMGTGKRPTGGNTHRPPPK